MYAANNNSDCSARLILHDGFQHTHLTALLLTDGMNKAYAIPVLKRELHTMDSPDQSKQALEGPQLYIDAQEHRDEGKGKEKANGTNTFTLNAGQLFKILFYALEDEQDTTPFELKYLSDFAVHDMHKKDEVIPIEDEDLEIMKEWSVKYDVSASVRSVRAVLAAQERKKINKLYHQRLIEWIYEDLEGLRHNIKEETGDADGSYEKRFHKLSILTLELARCDVSSDPDADGKTEVQKQDEVREHADIHGETGATERAIVS
ncbi:hypothetical protein E4T41_05989 [Aureobasidium subglaciale]|nr:hypothetical protein E4T41_05989 [Aureobasidium subglaciale]